MQMVCRESTEFCEGYCKLRDQEQPVCLTYFETENDNDRELIT
jgi:hypothetical protein